MHSATIADKCEPRVAALATIGEAARTALDEAAVEADRRGMRARKILATPERSRTAVGSLEMQAAAPRGAGRDEACAGEGESAPAGGLPRDAACLSHEANDCPVSRRRRGPPSPRGAPARRSHGRGRPRGCRASPPGAGARAAAVLLRRGEGRTEGRLGASGRVRSARRPPASARLMLVVDDRAAVAGNRGQVVRSCTGTVVPPAALPRGRAPADDHAPRRAQPQRPLR